MPRLNLSPEERAVHDAAVAERDRAAKRRWNQTHKEYRIAWRTANRDRINAQAREHARRKRAPVLKRKAALERGRIYREANRERERERGRRLREQYPERVREYARRYRERHPERFAEQKRRATQAYRDRHAERLRETNRAAAAVRRAANPDGYRAWYLRNRARERERGRQASRLRSRLTSLGLPPRRIHRTYANEKRAHQVAADAFFARTPDSALRSRLQAERPERGRVDRLWTSRVLQRLREEPPHPREVERFQRRSAAFRFRALMKDQLALYVAEMRRTRGAAIREEVRLDAVARNARRGPPLDVEAETARRIRVAAIELFLRHHPAAVRDIHTAVTDAISMVRTPQWWDTAGREEIVEMWHLAHTAHPEGHPVLARLIDAGTRTHHGIPARLYVAGHTAADLPFLQRRAQTRQQADTRQTFAAPVRSGGVHL